ncbi:MAG: cell envelope integrity protein TolA [Gammaproteobacteria bacterium]|nr:cell envelope integrity protein TolA [Gammaproteobacteria bacterium]
MPVRFQSLLAWLKSIIVHVAIAAAFVVTIEATAPDQQQAAVETIKATVIDQAQIDKVREAREAEERRRREAEEQRRREAEAERRRQAELEQQRKQEAERQRQAELEAQRKAEAEAQRKAEEEARRKAEAEAKRKAEEEARRKAEAEAKRKAEEEARARREAELEAAMQAEQQRIEAIQAGKLAQYQALIRQKVERNWVAPVQLDEEYYCELRVRQIPGGEVVGVSVVKCDDDRLARSLETAVLKSSPLPPPPDSSLFDRNIRLVFEPEGNGQ